MRDYWKSWELTVRCDICGEEQKHRGMEKGLANMAVRDAGWSLGKRDLCPKCLKRYGRRGSPGIAYARASAGGR